MCTLRAFLMLLLLCVDVGLFAASLTLLSDYYYILACPPAPPPPPPPQMIVSTAALLFVRLSVLQSVSTGWPPTHSFCSVWLQAPPPLCASSSVHHVSSSYCLLHLLSPSPLFTLFLFTSCFQLRWLQHGAFLIDLNKAFPNESFNLVTPPPPPPSSPLLSFPYFLLSGSGTLPHFHYLLFLPLHCVAGF